MTTVLDNSDASPLTLHLLDMGWQMFGDCILVCQGGVTVLIDGGHPGDYRNRHGYPSIPEQLVELLGHGPPFHVSLLVITHVHADHIGCIPTLVQEGDLTAEWALVADDDLGFPVPFYDSDGRLSSDANLPPLIVRRLVAALREEILPQQADAATVREFLSDSEKAESRYKRMLKTLEDRGTKVYRYGVDDATQLAAQFQSIGMKLLGPTRKHLEICSEQIAALTKDAVDAVSSRLAGDTLVDEVKLYRELTTRISSDAADPEDRFSKGSALNGQSIVLRFESKGKRVLLTGDMQFAKHSVRGLDRFMTELRQRVVEDGPYDFVKIAHHGSNNAFDESILRELQDTTSFGISGGINDEKHPNPDVLELLKRNRPRIQWARTDRNGLISVSFGPRGVTFEKSRGRLNSATPNTADQTPAVAMSQETELTRSVGAGPGEPPRGAGTVSVLARVPRVSTRVKLTIDVQPLAGPQAEAGGPPRRPVQVSRSEPHQTPRSAPDRPPRELAFAAGRELPELLFVTSRAALTENIGRDETDRLLESLRQSRQTVFDEFPGGLTDWKIAATAVRGRLGRSRFKGVVLLGGYDVIPPQRLDVLSNKMRARLSPRSREPDNHIVWCDEVYGDQDGDLLPELPVSRIPDGRSPSLLFAAIQAGKKPEGARRFGVRNVERPFADGVFELLPGPGDLLISEPTTYRDIRPEHVQTQALYFMLHGDAADGSSFSGEAGEEDQRYPVEAFNIRNIPIECPSVVFTGCCWGALCADTPAAFVRPGQRPAPRLPENSIALSFLAAGAMAFVGCTGAHYSPEKPDTDYFGGPMHQAFWRAYSKSGAPSLALFEAKKEYLKGMPHGRRKATHVAIEMKTLRQYTCLGLGW